MNRDNIIKIELLENVRVLNKHNNILFPEQKVIIIEHETGLKDIIDLQSGIDITGIDYFELKETKKTIKKTIFPEE